MYTLLFTLPGIPSIYYGSEWGIKGKKEGGNDDPLRPAVNLEEAVAQAEDQKLLEWVRTLGRIHKEQPALSEGTYQELLLTNRQYAFARIMGEEGVIVAVNNDENVAELHIRMPVKGKTCESLISGEMFEVQENTLHIKLLANESQIILIK